MKKFHFLLCSLFLFISLSQAQDKSKYELGFQAGLVLGTASDKNSQIQDEISGVGLGIHAKKNLGTNLALIIKFNYEQQGWSYKNLVLESPYPSGPPYLNADFLKRMAYLNVPILAEYSFGSKIRFHFNGGIFAGLLLESSSITRYENGGPDFESSPGGVYKQFNAGLATGIGISYPLSKALKINLETSQQFGLLNVEDNPQFNSTIRLNVFSFMTGLSFCF